MEIISKLIEIKVKLPIDNLNIEKELSNMGINPLRWSIVSGSRCEPASGCVEQAEQGSHNDGDVGLQAKPKPTGANLNKLNLTISVAYEDLC